MHRTWSSSFMIPQLAQRRPSTSESSGTQDSTTSPTAFEPYANARKDSTRTMSYSYLFTRTGLTTSTVPGPGALTGKMLKHLGEKVSGLAEDVVIRTKLTQMDKMQPDLLGSVREFSNDEIEEIFDQCNKLVELCIIGMCYRPVFMTRALGIIFSGFKRPGHQVWTFYIAEAISRRRKIEIYEIFRDCFFALLDESIFRIDGVVNLETLSFRCPAVAREIATIISHLAKKDCTLPRPQIRQNQSESSLEPEIPSDTAGENANIRASFSSVIIRAGFFRLASHWVEHGLPHWDVRGVERLEEALQDVACAQIYCGDLERHSEEANELVRKLRGTRLLVDNVTEMHETTGLDVIIEEAEVVFGQE